MRDRTAEREARRQAARARVDARTDRVEEITVPARDVEVGDWIIRIHPHANVRGVTYGDGARVTLAVPAWEAAEKHGLYGRHPVGAIAIQAGSGTVYAIRPENPVTIRRRYTK